MITPSSPAVPRRALLLGLGASALAYGHAAHARAPAKEEEPEISPAEDLMREHGLVRRVSLVYDDVRRRLAAGEAPDLAPLVDGAAIVRRVIEDYHEKLEEEHLFPRFRQAGRLVALVDVLEHQHVVGRRITDVLLSLPRGPGVAAPPGLVALLDGFDRMYAAHAAREDTVLFPAFREVVGERAYERLGERFEEEEHRVLGPGGFEEAVAQVAELERTVGLDDLAAFTPPEPVSGGG